MYWTKSFHPGCPPNQRTVCKCLYVIMNNNPARTYKARSVIRSARLRQGYGGQAFCV
jgi:coenzyme F420-reducing hydrogenase gamma subunit